MRKIVMCGVLALCQCFGAVSQNLYQYAASSTAVVSPEFPAKMTFAGSDVSFDRVDMYERMDREMISLCYSHTNTLLTIKRANRYYSEIMPILKEQGVPADFFYLAAIESHFDNRAVSYAKAGGLWQLMPVTAKELGLEVNDDVDERYNVAKATVAACKYLKRGFVKYNCWMTVASSYNAGMGRIGSQLEEQGVDNAFDLYLNNETSRYMFRILAMKTIMENPGRYGFKLLESQLYQPIGYTEKVVDAPVADWVAWAKQQGITYAQLREANPWIRSTSLPNKSGKEYRVRIPLKKDLYRSTQTRQISNKHWIVK